MCYLHIIWVLNKVLEENPINHIKLFYIVEMGCIVFAPIVEMILHALTTLKYLKRKNKKVEYSHITINHI